jgi:2,3-bisphosphoglycerate-independent phosphoglycerate mutase
MVGHTGNFASSVMAVEAVDLALSRLLPAIDALGGVALITADHGNAEEMFELDRKTGAELCTANGRVRAKTSHTLNPVPLYLHDRVSGGRLALRQDPDAGLANVAATTLHLLGYRAPPMWRPSLLEIRAI